MKKSRIIIVMCLIAHALTSNSQSYSIKSKDDIKKTDPQSSYIGGRIGLGLNGLSENMYPNTSNSGSISFLNIGGVAEFELGSHFSLQPELALISKGDKSSYNYSGSSYRYNNEAIVTASYIGLNCLPKFRWKIKTLDMFVYTGLGYLINTSSEVEEVSSNLSLGTSTRNTVKISQATNTLDLILGGGISKKTNSGKLFFDIRANRGLSSAYSSDFTGTKANQYGLNFGYLFEL